jgi:AbrB family looped-hinge helix DNA binding protein
MSLLSNVPAGRGGGTIHTCVTTVSRATVVTMVGVGQRAAQTAPVQVVVGPKGRVVIPAELREVLHLGPGDRMVAYVSEGRLVMERTETVLESIQRKWAPAKDASDRSAHDELFEDRRAQAAPEDVEEAR